MRNALPFIFLSAGMALLLVAPLPVLRSTQDMSVLCPSATTDAQHDWLGSLRGWPDSFLVLNWRAFIAITKGRAVPSPCR